MWRGKKSGKEEGKKEKLPGPREIPGIVQSHLTADKKRDPEWVRILRSAVRQSPKGERVFDIRIFDEAEAKAKKVEVKDYTSLDEHPDLTIYEGWFDEASKRVELEEKKKVSSDTTIFTEGEIQQKIEGLNEPGSTVFFYVARGAGHGGPLAMGCVIVELNPVYPAKRQKKYVLYTADVIDMQPTGKGQKLFGSDKPRDIARWIKDCHHQRLYSS